MAKRLQHRGGTTAQHSTFTGAVREVTVDTDKDTLVVHDGATAGGKPLPTLSGTETLSNKTLASPVATGTVDINGNLDVDGGTIKLNGNYPVGSDNVALGLLALNSVQASLGRNIAIGRGALQSNTSGVYNTAVGYSALVNNTTANCNTAIGYKSLQANRTGCLNTALGYQSLINNTTGNNNIGLGFHSLFSNTTASDNTAVGVNSLVSNTEGLQNVTVGNFSLDANTTGNFNTAVGYSSISANTTASDNTAVGYASLLANTTGASNVAIGRDALRCNTTASNNTAVGFNSLYANTTGCQNTALGISAGSSVTTGSNLTLLGYDAEPSSATATNEITLGDANVTTVRMGNGDVIYPSVAGITMADQWRLTADTNSGTFGAISTNWERNDDTNYSSLGTGLTESSGVFSFAQTGLYLINATFSIFLNSGDAAGNVFFQYLISNVANNAAVVDAESQGISSQITAGFIFNVTNISTHKFRFLTNSFSAGTLVNGNTDHNLSFFTAIRLGDSQ